MRNAIVGSRFKRDVKRMEKRGKDMAKLRHVIQLLIDGNPLPAQMADNRIITTVAQAPRMAENAAIRASNIEQGIERGSQRVADVVIEFHARTAMVKGMAKAFFLPGLTRKRLVVPVSQPIQQEQEQAIAAPNSEAAKIKKAELLQIKQPDTEG